MVGIMSLFVRGGDLPLVAADFLTYKSNAETIIYCYNGDMGKRSTKI